MKLADLWDTAPKKAEYTIEIAAMRLRPSYLRGMLTIWQAARYASLGGAAEEKMFFCGYDDCLLPIEHKNVGSSLSLEELRELVKRAPTEDEEELAGYLAKAGHLAVCPHCKRRLIASGYVAGRHTDLPEKFRKMKLPLLRDALLVAGSPEQVAETVAKYWETLEHNADIYMKTFPVPHSELVEKGWFDREDKPLTHPREELVVYAASNLSRDIAAGSTATKRIAAFLKA